MAELIITVPDGRTRRRGITHVVTTIGRGKANTVPLIDDGRVSLRHASIQRTTDGYVLRDENSSNGTLVDGVSVAEHHLVDGDRIQVGETYIVFRS